MRACMRECKQEGKPARMRAHERMHGCVRAESGVWHEACLVWRVARACACELACARVCIRVCAHASAHP
eukprot:12696715-Alexandrium_andersonii.AAC.1